MPTFRVRVNPHNSLETLAQYHVASVGEKIESRNYDRIGLDCASAIIAMAFAVEAILNFVGAKRVPGWNERASFAKKVAALQSRFRFSLDGQVEPYKTVLLLKKARDTMAHGQPIELEVRVESDRQIGRSMQPSWAAVATPEFVISAYQQVNGFKSFLFTRARIKAGASFTSASAVECET